MSQRSDVTIAEFANISHMRIEREFWANIMPRLLMVDEDFSA